MFAYLLSSLKEILISFDTGSSLVWKNEKFDFNVNLKFVGNTQVISLQSIQSCRRTEEITNKTINPSLPQCRDFT